MIQFQKHLLVTADTDVNVKSHIEKNFNVDLGY